MCIYPNCKMRANHNFEGETKRLYCASHKLDGMINKTEKMVEIIQLFYDAN